MITEKEYLEAFKIVNDYIIQKNNEWLNLKNNINKRRTTIADFIEYYDFEISVRLTNTLERSNQYVLVHYIDELLDWNVFKKIRNAGVKSFQELKEFVSLHEDEIIIN